MSKIYFKTLDCYKKHQSDSEKKKHISNKRVTYCFREQYLFQKVRRGPQSTVYAMYRSSHRRCSVKKVFFRNFTKSTGKHLCQSLLVNKVAGLKLQSLIKKETMTLVISCEFCEISNRTPPRDYFFM